MWYVARDYSHTDTRMLWKILSRPMSSKEDAESWMSYIKDEETCKKDAKFFVLYKEEDDIYVSS